MSWLQSTAAGSPATARRSVALATHQRQHDDQVHAQREHRHTARDGAQGHRHATKDSSRGIGGVPPDDTEQPVIRATKRWVSGRESRRASARWSAYQRSGQHRPTSNTTMGPTTSFDTACVWTTWTLTPEPETGAYMTPGGGAPPPPGYATCWYGAPIGGADADKYGDCGTCV